MESRIRSVMNTPLWRGMTICVMAGFVFILGIGPSPAGTWKYQVVPNDGHVLTYTDNGKVTFYLACGRGFALHTKYPGAAQKQGKARIAIANAKTKMGLEGEFEQPIDVQDPVPMNFATGFVQTYLGYAKNDPNVYGQQWMTTKARLLDLLGSGDRLTISVGKDSFQLPPIDAAGWRAPFDACGQGGSR